VSGDDPHALGLSPRDLRHGHDDLVRQFGCDRTQSADDGLARKPQRPLGVPAILAEPHQLNCCINCLSQIRPAGSLLTRSQIHGLGADVLIPRLQSVPRDHVDPHAQKLLKILEQTDMIQQRRTSGAPQSQTESDRGQAVTGGLRPGQSAVNELERHDRVSSPGWARTPDFRGPAPTSAGAGWPLESQVGYRVDKTRIHYA